MMPAEWYGQIDEGVRFAVLGPFLKRHARFSLVIGCLLGFVGFLCLTYISRLILLYRNSLRWCMIFGLAGSVLIAVFVFIAHEVIQ